jgi:hypothetical protein
MKLLEREHAHGHLVMELVRGDTGAVERYEIDNLVVDLGLNYIVSRMKDASVAAISHMAVGTGVTPAAAADAGLQAELARAAFGSVVVNDNQIVISATFAPGVGTGALTEAGIFNDAANGVMTCRTVFPVVNKQTSDTFSVTWTITIN